MRILGIIPARMGSSRFPGKPLEEICGVPMIGHCYYRTKMAQGVNETYVATCDKEIYEYIESIGGSAIMTDNTHIRATTRVAEAMEMIDKRANKKTDIVIMVQGDEPLVSPDVISEIIPHFQDDSVDIVNVMTRINTINAFKDKNNVKAVVDNNKNALYFSREPIPSSVSEFKGVLRYMQTGIIAFRRDALIRFNSLQETPLERAESVDMNRVLETGGKIRMVLSNENTIGVDVPGELKIAEDIMISDKVFKKYMKHEGK